MNIQVALLTKNEKVIAEMKAASASTNIIIFNNPDLDSIAEDQYVICDVLSFLYAKDRLNNTRKDRLYVLSPDTDENNMALVEKHQLFHLVGLNEGIFGAEIIYNLSKGPGKIWGLQHYLAPDSEIKIISLSDSKYTNEMITETLGHFDFKEYFASPIEYIQVMANELISNSFYKGPNRRRAQQGLDSIDRKSHAFLKGSELIQVTLGMDHKGVALSVQDSFGGLSYKSLIESLKRSFTEKTPMEKNDGAGLGLYLTFLHSNQFIVNYRKDFRTEVICIIDKNKRYKNYKQRIRSFHFFHEVKGEKVHN